MIHTQNFRLTGIATKATHCATILACAILFPATICPGQWEHADSKAAISSDPVAAFNSFTMHMGGNSAIMAMVAGQTSGGLSLKNPKDFIGRKGTPQSNQAPISTPLGLEPLDQDAPEIKSIAAALDYDMGRILVWVKNYIRFEPYNGLMRGARLTAIERTGNSFDTSALAVALLRASGFNASYVFAQAYYPTGGNGGVNAANWLGVAPDRVADYLASSGCSYVPITDDYDESTPIVVSYPNAGYVRVPHMFVRVRDAVGGILGDFDVSFKIYSQNTNPDDVEYTPKRAWENFATLTYKWSDILGAVSYSGDPKVFKDNTGAKTAVRSRLSKQTTDLVRTVLGSYDWHMDSGMALMGARMLSERNADGAYDTNIAFTNGSPEEWEDIGDEYKVRLRIWIGNTDANGGGFVREYPTALLRGRRLCIAFSGSLAQLYLEDNPITDAIESSTNYISTAAVKLKFIYTTTEDPEDPPLTNPAPIARRGIHVITYGFGDCLGRLRERMRIQADMADSGILPADFRITRETLNTIGLQYLNQLNALNEVASTVNPVRIRVLHFAGIVGKNDAPFVDLPVIRTVTASKDFGISDAQANDNRDRAFLAYTYWGSMLEHNVIEQAIVNDADPNNTYLDKAVSTVKLLQSYVDGNVPIHMARTPAEWTSLRSQLTTTSGGYAGTPTLAEVDAYMSGTCVDPTFTLAKSFVLLPATYNQKYQNYSGIGYMTFRTETTLGDGSPITNRVSLMGITGALGTTSGGAFAIANDLLFQNTSNHSLYVTGATWTNYEPINLSSNLASIPSSTAGDPVDLASGALTIAATDLTLGGAAPFGLAFTRYYSSSLRRADPTGLGKGWTHSYNIRLTFQHSNTIDIYRASLAEVAPMMIATRAIYNMIDTSETADIRNWVVPALVANWAGTQLINKRAVVTMGDRSLEFTKLPDDSFAPSPGVAATLAKNGTNHVLQFRKGLEIIFREKDGRFTSITDRRTSGQTARVLKADYTGNPSSWNDDTQRLTKVTDAYGRYLTFSNSGTTLNQVADSASRTVKYSASDNANGAFTYTDPENNDTHYYWDAKHRITKITDPFGRITVSSTYDDYDRVTAQCNMGDITQCNMDGTERVWTYDYAPGVARYGDPYGNASLYYFDSKGRKISYIDENGEQTDWAYDGVDRLISTTTPARNISYLTGSPEYSRETTCYDYDQNHECIRVTDNQGHMAMASSTDDNSNAPFLYGNYGSALTRITYYPGIHLVKSFTKRYTSGDDSNNITDTFDAYDTYGRLTKYHPAAYAAGQYVTYAYTPATGIPTQMTATYPGGGKENTYFDSIGNIIKKTDRAGITTTFTYNNRRQLIKTIVGDGSALAQTSTTSYDDAGNVEYTIDPNGNSTDYIYNADGKLTSVSGPNGETTTCDYDLRGLLVQTTNPVGAKSTTTYDPAGRASDVTNPLGGITHFEYDPLGNRTSIASPLAMMDPAKGSITDFEYDDARNLPTATIDGKGNPVTYTYDPDGRQTTMTTARSGTYSTDYDDFNRTVSTLTPARRLTDVKRNPRGLVEECDQIDGRTLRNTSFDAEGRVRTQQILAPNGALLTTSTMTYDPAGRLWQVKENNGNPSIRGYDTLGRLASYQDGEGNMIAYGYDLANNLVTLIYPGLKVVNYTYDSYNRISTITDWNGRKTEYAYDPAGRLIKTTRRNNANTIITTREQTYDLANRLRMITERKSDGTLLWMRTLDYDADGRITKMLTTPTQSSAGTPAANAGDTATYDADNQLATWNSTACAFDADGNMTYGPPPPTSTSTLNLNYTFDARNRLTGVNNQTLYRYNPDGLRVEANNVKCVIDPNAPLSRVLMRGNTYYIWGANGLEYEINGTTTKTYHADHLGSTMLLTDDSGNTIASFEYDSYGNPSPNNSNVTPFRWHGTLGCITDDNGLIYMRARYYNPRIMRWLNSDPSGFAGGMNLFAAFGNNPITNVDPLGLQVDDPGAFVQDFFAPPGNVEEARLAQYEVENGLPYRSIPRGQGYNPGAEYVKGVIFTPLAVGAAAVTVVGAVAVAPEAMTGGAIYESVATGAAAINNASLIPQAAILSRAPQLYTVGMAAAGFIQAASPGAPSAITSSSPVVAWSEAAGYAFGYRDQIITLSQDAYNLGKTTLSNINDSLTRLNEPWPTPPGMFGSVILSVPSPKPAKPPGKG